MLEHRSTTYFRPRSRISALGFVQAALAAWKQRRQIERLDVDALNDIGISPEEARREAAKPIWDVPKAWRR